MKLQLPSRHWTASLSGILVAAALSACVSPIPKSDPHHVDEKAIAALAAVGAAQFGIDWVGPPQGAREGNVLAVTDGVTTLTTHAGSRMYLLHNRRAFPPTSESAFDGADEQIKAIGQKFLRAAGAKMEEVADMHVLQQFTQIGQKLSDGKRVRVLPPERSHRSLLISRRVEGIEVVSSRVQLYVDSAGRAAFLEMAWPDISPEVLSRARLLSSLSEGKTLAPHMEGAVVESVTPVILHSPVQGFFNDSTAALRVIYRSQNKQIGKKAVRYIGERGQDVAMPRAIDQPREESLRRTAVRQ